MHLQTILNLKNGAEVLIREATPEDAAELIRLIHQYLGTSEYMILTADEFTPTVEEEVQWINSFIEQPNSSLLVATHNGKLIGNIDCTGNNRKRLAHTGMIGMGIDAKWRNLGLGSLLMNTMLNWATENPTLERLILHVFADNHTAIHLYKKSGFSIECRQERFIKLSNEKYTDNLIMSRAV